MTNNMIKEIFSGIFSLLLEKRKEHREDKKEKEVESKKIYEERPELKIIKYKEHLKKPGKKLNKKCDINVFMTRVERGSTDNYAHYNPEFFNKRDWCCVVYKFKNIGKTDIRFTNVTCTYKKDVILCDVNNSNILLEHNLLNYSILCDKKIYVNDTFTMRVCFHKNCIVEGLFTAIVAIMVEDSNGNYWIQPLFVPEDRIYESSMISHEEYIEFVTKQCD